MTKREIKSALKHIIKTSHFEQFESFDGDGTFLSHYLGSYFALDPCGRYHHVLSVNGAYDDENMITVNGKRVSRCEHFWKNLEQCANELNCWIQSGEGNSTDIFLCKLEDKAK